jgi:hypothetical protein
MTSVLAAKRRFDYERKKESSVLLSVSTKRGTIPRMGTCCFPLSFKTNLGYHRCYRR